MRAGGVALIALGLGVVAGSLCTGLAVAYHYETKTVDHREQEIQLAWRRCEESDARDIAKAWRTAAAICFARSGVYTRTEAR